MKKIQELLGFMADPKSPKHELAASVDEILKVVGETKRYSYGYWLRRVKQSGKSYGDILSLLKSIEGMDEKYNKGGVITNKLKK